MSFDRQQAARDRADLEQREYDMTPAERSSAWQDQFVKEDHAQERWDEQGRRDALARGGLGYSSRPFDLTGTLALVAMIGAALGVIATAVIAITWWMGAGDTLRSILEASPLSGSVAKSAGESGAPAVVVGVVGALVALALAAISFWRRRLALRCVHGELHRGALFGASVLRTVVLFGGLSALPVVGAIAAGKDLEETSDTTVLGSPMALGIVFVVVLGYSLISSGRRWEAAAN